MREKARVSAIARRSHCKPPAHDPNEKPSNWRKHFNGSEPHKIKRLSGD